MNFGYCKQKQKQQYKFSKKSKLFLLKCNISLTQLKIQRKIYNLEINLKLKQKSLKDKNFTRILTLLYNHLVDSMPKFKNLYLNFRLLFNQDINVK